MSGSGISWSICKSAPRPKHKTMPESHHSVFYRPDALTASLPANQQQQSTECKMVLYKLKLLGFTITMVKTIVFANIIIIIILFHFFFSATKLHR